MVAMLDLLPWPHKFLLFYTMNGMWELDETYTFTSKGSGFLTNHHYLSLPSSCLIPRGLVCNPAVCTEFDTVPGIPYSSGVGRASWLFHYQFIVTSSVSDCNSLQISQVVLARSIHTDSKDIRRIPIGAYSSCHDSCCH